MSTACGKPVLEVQGFEPYIERFELEAQSRGIYIKIVDLKIEMVIELESGGGVCKLGLGTPIIQIKANTFLSKSEEGKEMIIFHELAHCILGQGHRELDQVKELGSIMTPFITVTERNYKEHRQEVLDELFNHVRN